MSAETDRWAADSRARIAGYDKKRLQHQPVSGKTMPELLDLPIGGSRSFQLAVLSIDIRGFTRIAMELDNPRVAELARLQALYLTEMSAIIRDHNGVTEKYTGDGVMGLFGTESETTSAKDVRDAVGAALTAKLLARRTLNPYLREIGVPEIECGFGIDYGPVIMERVGLRGDNQFSLAGPTVSLAAKLQGAAEPWQILIGEDIKKRLPSEWQEFVKPAPSAWKSLGFRYTGYLFDAVWRESEHGVSAPSASERAERKATRTPSKLSGESLDQLAAAVVESLLAIPEVPVGEIAYVRGDDFRVLDKGDNEYEFHHEYFPGDRHKVRHKLNSGEGFRVGERFYRVDPHDGIVRISIEQMTKDALPRTLAARVDELLAERIQEGESKE